MVIISIALLARSARLFIRCAVRRSGGMQQHGVKGAHRHHVRTRLWGEALLANMTMDAQPHRLGADMMPLPKSTG